MGTATWKGPTTSLVEAVNSPSYEASDRIIKTRTYHGLFTFCETEFPDYAKGTAGTGAEAGYTIASSSLQKIRGGIGQLTVKWEASSSDSGQPLPNDEVAVSGTNQSPRLERHPNYVSLDAAALINVETALRAQEKPARDTAYAALSATGKELVDKIRKGNESYYLATLRYVWVTHSYTLPTSTRGGYVESIGGPLAAYFVSGIEWLRESDNLDYSNGIWRRTIAWLGADAWDADIYPP